MDRFGGAGKRYLVAGAGIVAIAVGAFFFGINHPLAGPIAATIAPQGYVESLTDGDIPQHGPYVLVDAASARLFMIEDGKVRDSMKVIVGKPGHETPAFNATMNTATLNPYWNVPPDLARSIVAPRVLKDGEVYLTDRGYEILSDNGPNPHVVAWDSVDWKAIADGTKEVRMRQRPGPYNSMGKVKFNLARADGIFLHDTPHKELFAKNDRDLSNGCVRLEDAPRLAKWALGRDLALNGPTPEQNLTLRKPVPVTIAYLDAAAQAKVKGLQ